MWENRAKALQYELISYCPHAKLLFPLTPSAAHTPSLVKPMHSKQPQEIEPWSVPIVSRKSSSRIQGHNLHLHCQSNTQTTPLISPSVIILYDKPTAEYSSRSFSSSVTCSLHSRSSYCSTLYSAYFLVSWSLSRISLNNSSTTMVLCPSPSRSDMPEKNVSRTLFLPTKSSHESQ